MTLELAILAVITALTTHTTDRTEPKSAREARLTMAAESVAHACKGDVKCSAALLTIMTAESEWAGYVGRGECTKGPVGARCDLGKDGKPRAWGYPQVWTSAAKACKAAHDDALPLPARHDAAAICARDRWNAGMKACVGKLDGAFRYYHRGACLVDERSEKPKYSQEMARRVKMVGEFERKLHTARKAGQ